MNPARQNHTLENAMTEPTFATRAAALRQRNDELAASQPGQR
ncbi:hemin-degrading factor, partial [Bordetella pertussis]